MSYLSVVEQEVQEHNRGEWEGGWERGGAIKYHQKMPQNRKFPETQLSM